jgi:hypothetical protein
MKFNAFFKGLKLEKLKLMLFKDPQEPCMNLVYHVMAKPFMRYE